MNKTQMPANLILEKNQWAENMLLLDLIGYSALIVTINFAIIVLRFTPELIYFLNKSNSVMWITVIDRLLIYYIK